MFCTNCGTKLDDNSTFCTACGAAVTSDNSAQRDQTDFPDPTVLPGQDSPHDPITGPHREQNINRVTGISDHGEPAAFGTGFSEGEAVPPTDYPAPPPQTPYPQQQYSPQPPQDPNIQHMPPNTQYFSQIPVAHAPQRSNVLLGTIGAVVFSLIGCVIWVVIGSFGYISYIGGFALSLLTITGYRLLGKKFDVPGVLISLVIVVLAVFASSVFINAFAIAADEELMDIMRYIGYNDFKDIFLRFFDLVKDVDMILETYAPGEGTMMQEFLVDLGISYVFAGIAFAVTAVSQYKASKYK